MGFEGSPELACLVRKALLAVVIVISPRADRPDRRLLQYLSLILHLLST